MKRAMMVLVSVIVLALVVSPAMAHLVRIESRQGPQDRLEIQGLWHEIGQRLTFPFFQAIDVGPYEVTDYTSCYEGPGDDPEIRNYYVEIRNGFIGRGAGLG